MNKKEKEDFVASMKSRLEKAKGTFLVGYQGLDMEALNVLRKALKKNNVDFRVIKNRLLKLASKETETDVINKYFVGCCALAISYDDLVTPAKILIEKSKQLKRLEIKVGQISGKAIDFDSIKRLAELPGREVLLSQLLSGMQAVPAKFVRVLNAVVLNFLYTLKAVEEKKKELIN